MNTPSARRRFLMLLCWTLGTGAWAQSPPSRLVLAGSTTMAPLMAEVAKRFQARHPAIGIEVRMGGSSRGIADVRSGSANIGMVSRLLTDTERDLYGIPVARDGVAVIVHRDNPVAALDRRQLADIYAGRIGNWRQVGGRDMPIVVLAATPEGGSSDLFGQYLRLPYERFAASWRIGANADRIAAVAAAPGAVVYLSLGEAERKARQGAGIKLLAVDGVTASSRNVRSGNYPISRPLMLVTLERPTGAARAFVEFCVSSQITDLALAFDFVPYLD